MQQQPMGSGPLYGPNTNMQQPMDSGPSYGYNPYVQQPYNQNQQYRGQQQNTYQQNNTAGKWVNGKWVSNGYPGGNQNDANKGKPDNVYGFLAALVSLILAFVFRWLGGVIALAAFIYCLDGIIRSRKKAWGVLGLVLSLITMSIIVTMDSNRSNNSDISDNSSSVQVQVSTKDNNEEKKEEKTTEAVQNNTIPVASDFSNMKIGDICCNEELYIGLSYAKLSDTFTTGLGSQEDISTDKQVLFAFFDVYNSGNDKKNISDDSFSCYVDGINFSEVETYFYYEEDGITNQLSSDLYDNTNKMIITNFEIPKEWEEIKLYYGSDCIWNLSPDDVSSEPFEMNSMYDVNYVQDGTAEGSIIYSDKYEITYDGYEYHTEDYSNDNMLIVKFTINNTGSSELDYSLVGYNMNCYANNYVTDNANYSIDDKFGDYVNVYNIDSIQAGMKAKIYFAFKITGSHDFYRIVYDAGYIADDYLADIYINEGIATNTDSDESIEQRDNSIESSENNSLDDFEILGKWKCLRNGEFEEITEFASGGEVIHEDNTVSTWELNLDKQCVYMYYPELEWGDDYKIEKYNDYYIITLSDIVFVRTENYDDYINSID
jgi:hypothetical protein